MKKLKTKFQILELNSKKEITKLIVISTLILVLPVLLYVFLENFFYLGIGVLVAVSLIILYINQYDFRIEKRRIALEMEFIEVFSYLRIYLSNKENVYRSLKKASEYTSVTMKKEITTFLEKIDEDKSIIPFIEFSEVFKNKVIEEVMISLYQMIDGGFTKNYLDQFISLFDNFKNRYLEEDMIKRYKKIDFFNSLSLVGGGYLMIVMLLVVLNVIGSMINGF